jgi:head-tail adaptor
MQAGRLDRRVKLQKLVESQSDSGAVVETPHLVATVWAEKIPERGTERFAEDQVQGWAVVRWRLRWFQENLEDPTVKWQLVEGQRVYDVQEVREIGRREGWEFVTRCRAEDQAT